MANSTQLSLDSIKGTHLGVLYCRGDASTSQRAALFVPGRIVYGRFCVTLPLHTNKLLRPRTGQLAFAMLKVGKECRLYPSFRVSRGCSHAFVLGVHHRARWRYNHLKVTMALQASVADSVGRSVIVTLLCGFNTSRRDEQAITYVYSVGDASRKTIPPRRADHYPRRLKRRSSDY